MDAPGARGCRDHLGGQQQRDHRRVGRRDAWWSASTDHAAIRTSASHSSVTGVSQSQYQVMWQTGAGTGSAQLGTVANEIRGAAPAEMALPPPGSRRDRLVGSDRRVTPARPSWSRAPRARRRAPFLAAGSAGSAGCRRGNPTGATRRCPRLFRGIAPGSPSTTSSRRARRGHEQGVRGRRSRASWSRAPASTTSSLSARRRPSDQVANYVRARVVPLAEKVETGPVKTVFSRADGARPARTSSSAIEVLSRGGTPSSRWGEPLPRETRLEG